MTNNHFSREELLNIIETDHVQCGEASALARMALAAMGDEPHTDDELSNLLWYSQEATCHSDPNYYCEFQLLATPGFIAWIIRELQERRKAAMGSEPYGFTDGDRRGMIYEPQYADRLTEPLPVYRHAQPAPVVPDIDELRLAFEAAERESDDGFNLHKYGIGYADDETQGRWGMWLACRAAMLSGDNSILKIDHNSDFIKHVKAVSQKFRAGNSPVIPDGWIKCSDQPPPDKEYVWCWGTYDDLDEPDGFEGYYDATRGKWWASNNGDYVDGGYGGEYKARVTHWMPLPAAPQEVKRES